MAQAVGQSSAAPSGQPSFFMFSQNVAQVPWPASRSGSSGGPGGGAGAGEGEQL